MEFDLTLPRTPGRTVGSAGTYATAVADALGIERFAVMGHSEYDHQFSPADFAAFESGWSWFSEVVGPAEAGGPGGHVDDNIAYVTPWGCDPAQITAPVLLIHGGRDKVVPSRHAEWLAKRCPRAELRIVPDGAHISVMTSGEAALEWIRSAAS